MPEASLEVRWFVEGAVDDALVAWFRRDVWERQSPIQPPEWPAEGERGDRYLLLPGVDDLGIKLRSEVRSDGVRRKLEFKGRVAVLGTMAYGPHRGQVERWTKWSYKELAVPPVFVQLVDADHAVAVEKRRIRRKLRFDASGTVVEVPLSGPGSVPDRGMGIELTRLVVGGHVAWTLALEAFPNDDETYGAFARNVALFLDGAPRTFEADASMGYPAWLGSLG